jgi:hypothetical protein
MVKNLSILLLTILLGPKLLWSQQVIASAGDFYSNSAGMISQTIGEAVIETYASPVVILTQGFQQSHLVPLNTILQNVIVAPGQSTCYSAQQVIVLAGGGTTFTVNAGGAVTLIAGQKIQMEPGVWVQPAGYLHGYITTTGQFCNTLKNDLVGSGETEPGNDVPAPVTQTSLFKVYPNPTDGSFTLELKMEEIPSGSLAEISGLRGENVLKQQLSGQKKYEFSLLSYPAGIYFIRVTSGGKTQSAKIIKQ